jgi:subfamily B ATP-binding cassette protein MsbA
MTEILKEKVKIASDAENKTWPLVRRLAGNYLTPHIGMLILALIFMVIAAGMTAAFALILEPVINKVLIAGDVSRVWALASGIFLIFFIRGVAGYADTVLMQQIGQTIVATIQKQMFSHFMDMDLRFFHQNPSGQLISRIINDVDAVRNAVTNCLTGIGKNIMTLIFLIGVMFYQDWILALAALTIFPLAAAFVAWIGRKLRQTSKNIQEGKAGLSDRLSQIFQGIRLVKAYGMEGQEIVIAGKAIGKVRSHVLKAERIGNLSTPVNETLVGFVVFGIIAYGGYQVAAGGTTAGELMSFIAAFTMAYEPMKKLAKLNNSLQMGLGAAERVFEMIDRRADIENKEGAKEITLKQPEVVFENVQFQYDDDERKALNRVSITIPAGKVTALVGRSGSGKTTIMNLIPRFFDVTSGRVLVGGKDVRDVTLESLRSNIALVSQDIVIFDDTVWANIGYSKEGAFQDEIIKAAIAAEADEFIRELPNGYDTKLGEDGVTLSGGQRQRLSIARAILRDAPILLLDEATSALDNEAERAIQKTLSEIQKGRTTLVIAHRLSTIQNADQIIVLEQGDVVEHGTHDQLMSNQSTYAAMYEAGLNN